MRYEIDNKTFAISIFHDDDAIPFQIQPDYPNGDLFDSVEEASAWAEASIAAHSPECKVFAPNGKGLAGEVKQDPIEVQAVLDKLGLTAEEARALFR